MKVEEVIGANVAWLREDREMSQAQLGEKLGTYLEKPWSRQAVSAAEKGRRAFTSAELVSLAFALETTVPSLLLLRNWHPDREVELSEQHTVTASEYREVLMHGADPVGKAQLITRSNLETLQRSLITLQNAHSQAGDALDIWSDTIKYLQEVASFVDSEKSNIDRHDTP